MKIRVKVVPNAKHEGVTVEGDYFVVRVKEPPKEGRANQAVIKLLAEYFGVSQNQVAVSSGIRSRNKVIQIS